MLDKWLNLCYNNNVPKRYEKIKMPKGKKEVILWKRN